MASEVIYVTINAPTVESIPTTVGGAPTNVVDVDLIGEYNAVVADLQNAQADITTLQSEVDVLQSEVDTLQSLLTRTDWVTVPSYSNSWVGTLKYCKFAGFGMLAGYVGAGTIDTKAFTLPVGFRPLDWTYAYSVGEWPVSPIQGGSSGIITIEPDGDVIPTGNYYLPYATQVRHFYLPLIVFPLA